MENRYEIVIYDGEVDLDNVSTIVEVGNNLQDAISLFKLLVDSLENTIENANLGILKVSEYFYGYEIQRIGVVLNTTFLFDRENLSVVENV
jgi:hypothetical protein